MRRREFLKHLGIITGAGTVSLTISGIPVKAFAKPFMNIKSTNGKILVIIQLKGGNDGLNTVIPIEDSIYYNSRPNIAIAKEAALKINDVTGFHPSLLPFKELFDAGKLSVVQNVGYENPNRSHFRSTDIWLSGSDANQYVFDGWVGRYLEKAYPDYPDSTPEHPMAIQLGSVQSLLLDSQHGGMGVAFEDPNTFFQLVSGSSVDSDPPPNTIAGEELKFLKQISAQSVQYASVIKEIADSSSNQTTYPDTKLAAQLAIIAELIAGGLQTPVYLATINGFDTHASQEGTHDELLSEVADAVKAFQTDLELQGVADKVITLTISEFGRRVAENGSAGTDHGTAAPLFIIGNNVNGGFIGDNPDLNDLEFGDLKHVYDFRQVYATMLKDHFEMEQQNINEILFKEFKTLPIINSSTTGTKENLPANFSLSQNYPNPFNPSTKINYTIAKSGNVKINVFDSLGRRINSLVNKFHTPGSYSIVFNAGNLSSGNYFYRIEAEGFSGTKKMILIK